MLLTTYFSFIIYYFSVKCCFQFFYGMLNVAPDCFYLSYSVKCCSQLFTPSLPFPHVPLQIKDSETTRIRFKILTALHKTLQKKRYRHKYCWQELKKILNIFRTQVLKCYFENWDYLFNNYKFLSGFCFVLFS